MAEETGTQRIDRWLWHARVARTRTTAAALVTGGRVRLNRERLARASQPVRAGDVVTVAAGGGCVLVLRVVALSARRGPAAEARLLYEDLSTPAPPPDPSGPRPDSGRGRPTKRDRRRLDELRQDIASPENSAE